MKVGGRCRRTARSRTATRDSRRARSRRREHEQAIEAKVRPRDHRQVHVECRHDRHVVAAGPRDGGVHARRDRMRTVAGLHREHATAEPSHEVARRRARAGRLRRRLRQAAGSRLGQRSTMRRCVRRRCRRSCCPRMRSARRRVELGHALFFDKRLSANNDRSCYSCHQNEDGNGGHDPIAIGSGDKKQTRHAPVIWNVGYYDNALYWDGRAKDLEANAKGAWAKGNMGGGRRQARREGRRARRDRRLQEAVRRRVSRRSRSPPTSSSRRSRSTSARSSATTPRTTSGPRATRPR